MKILGYALIGCLIILQISCAHKDPRAEINEEVSKPAPDIKPEDLKIYADVKPQLPPYHLQVASPNAVSLKFKLEKDREEITEGCFESTTKTYLKDEIRGKRIEAVSFKIKTLTLPPPPDEKTGAVHQMVETIYKDGPTNLHDLAFPELGEKIEFIYSPEGNVLGAGNYAKGSIFYVPPLPLPTKPVKVGDTWEQENRWRSSVQDGFELRSKLIARFESWKPCGVSQCAEIKVAGVVNIPEKLEKAAGYGHKLTGLFLIDPKRGLVPWAKFESEELVQGTEARVAVRASLRSYLLQPQGYYKVSREERACPSEKAAE